MISFNPFEAGDLNGFSPRDSASSAILKSIKRVSGHKNVYILSMKKNNKTIGIFGLSLLWDGVGEGWSLLDKDISKYPFSLHRVTKEMIPFVFRTFDLKRLQITVRSCDLRSVKWAKVLGFNLDGKMSNYGPDLVDYYLYSKCEVL